MMFVSLEKEIHKIANRNIGGLTHPVYTCVYRSALHAFWKYLTSLCKVNKGFRLKHGERSEIMY